MTSDELAHPGGRLLLTRTSGGNNTLRAWDAADELLLEHACACLAERPNARVLVVDDLFGALTLGLAQHHPTVVADLATLRGALQRNAVANDLVPPPLHSWLSPPQGRFDLVVMRIPRQADYLGWLLARVNELLEPEGCLLAGGMIKHIPDQSTSVFAQHVHTREVSPARKKARVITCVPGAPSASGEDGWRGYRLEVPPLQLDALPAVFARQKLDIGTRWLLPHIPGAVATLSHGARVLDLGCGNGVLGLTALSTRQDLKVTFCDVSSQAIASARRNLQQNLPGTKADFLHEDGLSGDSGLFDLVLLNPPFHEGGVVGDHIALALFKQVSQYLAGNGLMLMVGNRHLGYHRSLRRYFRQVEQLDADPKFVVFRTFNH